jgi:hypothetical protein
LIGTGIWSCRRLTSTRSTTVASSLDSSMRRIGLPVERVRGEEQLVNVIASFLTPRPRHQMRSPAVLDISPSGHLIADGQYVRAYSLGKLPAAIPPIGLHPSSTVTFRSMSRSILNPWTSAGRSSSWMHAATPWNPVHQHRHGALRWNRLAACVWPTSAARRCRCAWRQPSAHVAARRCHRL